MPSQSKHWCFTLNNYNDAHVTQLENLGASSEVAYLVFGREIGENETPHLQGFVSFAKKKVFNSARRLLSEQAHLEVARGTPEQASTYCKKEGDFQEFGVLPGGRGSRTDLASVVEEIKKGASYREVTENHPSAVVRYGSGLLRLKQHFRPTPRNAPPEILVLWGPTGSGKTRRVWEFAQPEALWVHPGDRWFDGYDGHPSVLFDDFDGSWFKLSYLLKLLDRYQFQVPVKGGYVWWNPTHIFITSNIEPQEWFPSANEEHQKALKRRLTQFGKIEHVQ